MRIECFPDSKLEFMHEVWDKQQVVIESELRQTDRKGTLMNRFRTQR